MFPLDEVSKVIQGREVMFCGNWQVLVDRRFYAAARGIADRPIAEIGVVFPAVAQTDAGDGHAHHELAIRLSNTFTKYRILITSA